MDPLTRKIVCWAWNYQVSGAFPYQTRIEGTAMIFAQTAAAAALPRQAAAIKTSSDEALVTRIAAGDQIALRALCARHQVRLYRFLVRMVRDERLAEELLADVFLDVWRHAAEFEARATVSTWLLAIGRYKALTALRRRTDVSLDDKMACAIPDSGDDPEVLLQKKDTGEVLRKCVAALSPAQGQIIDLVYYHEKTISEVAQIVGIPEATVKTRMFYARKNLAEMVRAA
jgi:RNA polymerase sigma-70 factor (ECF subfamily)